MLWSLKFGVYTEITRRHNNEQRPKCWQTNKLNIKIFFANLLRKVCFSLAWQCARTATNLDNDKNGVNTLLVLMHTATLCCIEDEYKKKKERIKCKYWFCKITVNNKRISAWSECVRPGALCIRPSAHKHGRSKESLGRTADSHCRQTTTESIYQHHCNVVWYWATLSCRTHRHHIAAPTNKQ